MSPEAAAQQASAPAEAEEAQEKPDPDGPGDAPGAVVVAGSRADRGKLIGYQQGQHHVPPTKSAEATSRPRVSALEIFDSSLVRTAKVPIMLATMPMAARTTG